jgi:hypothetical protein
VHDRTDHKREKRHALLKLEAEIRRIGSVRAEPKVDRRVVKRPERLGREGGS